MTRGSARKSSRRLGRAAAAAVASTAAVTYATSERRSSGRKRQSSAAVAAAAPSAVKDESETEDVDIEKDFEKEKPESSAPETPPKVQSCSFLYALTIQPHLFKHSNRLKNFILVILFVSDRMNNPAEIFTYRYSPRINQAISSKVEARTQVDGSGSWK